MCLQIHFFVCTRLPFDEPEGDGAEKSGGMILLCIIYSVFSVACIHIRIMTSSLDHVLSISTYAKYLQYIVFAIYVYILISSSSTFLIAAGFVYVRQFT